jgi:predicted RNase H-like HicB family nuclease
MRGIAPGTFARIFGFFQTAAGPASMKAIRIRAVVFKEGGWWCAQCLEHDIATQAKTIDDLKAEIERVLTIHVELALERGQEPFSILPPAPDRYFQMYDAFEQAGRAEDAKPIKFGADAVQQCILARYAYLQMAAV